MKTVKNFATLFLVLFTVIGTIQATEFTKTAADPALEIEGWMTSTKHFRTNSDLEQAQSIVEIAVSNPNFSLLVEALTKAEMVNAVSTDGPFTVFAPNNEAFKALFHKLGINGLNELTKEQLTPILTYHVVSGKILSTDLTNSDVATLNGAKLTIDLSDGVKVNKSKVIAADILGSNGVIHVIDQVLIPN